MRSEGRNLDIFDHSPQRMLAAAIEQLKTAEVDPNFYGSVKDDRIQHYKREVERWEALCKMTA